MQSIHIFSSLCATLANVASASRSYVCVCVCVIISFPLSLYSCSTNGIMFLYMPLLFLARCFYYYCWGHVCVMMRSVVKGLWFMGSGSAQFSCLKIFRFDFITYYNAIKYNKIKYSLHLMERGLKYIGTWCALILCWA